jgi:hypothetical protein
VISRSDCICNARFKFAPQMETEPRWPSGEHRRGPPGSRRATRERVSLVIQIPGSDLEPNGSLSAIGLLPRIGGERVPGYGGVAGGEPVFRVRVAERLCVGLELNFQVAEPLTFIQPNRKLAISRRLVLQMDA